jgi:hypothetical protein
LSARPTRAGGSFPFAPLVLGSFLFCAAAVQGSDPYKAALAKAKKDQSTPTGKAYDILFMKKYKQVMIQRVKFCSSSYADPKKFSVLMDLDKNGSVIQVLTEPQGPRSDCFSELFAGAKCPIPPFPGFWYQLRMSSKK